MCIYFRIEKFGSSMWSFSRLGQKKKEQRQLASLNSSKLGKFEDDIAVSLADSILLGTPLAVVM